MSDDDEPAPEQGRGLAVAFRSPDQAASQPQGCPGSGTPPASAPSNEPTRQLVASPTRAIRRRALAPSLSPEAARCRFCFPIAVWP